MALDKIDPWRRQTKKSKVLSLKMRIISLKGRLLEYSEELQCYVRTLSIFNTLSRITDFS